MGSVTKLHHIEDLQGKNVVLLFGKTRAGKSTFINDAYGEKVVTSTAGITSDTDKISYVNQPCYIDGQDVFLVDTVGLGGSGEGHDRASFTLNWLHILHPGENSRGSSLVPIIKGILYFIDIMDGAMNQDNIRNLKTFKALVGEEVLESVVFVTTKWLTKEEKSGRIRLEANYVGWKEKIRADFPRASIVRLDDTTGRLSEARLNQLSLVERAKKERGYHNNAMKVLQQVLRKPATQPMLAQREMYASRNQIRKAAETTLDTDPNTQTLNSEDQGHGDCAFSDKKASPTPFPRPPSPSPSMNNDLPFNFLHFIHAFNRLVVLNSV